MWFGILWVYRQAKADAAARTREDEERREREREEERERERKQGGDHYGGLDDDVLEDDDDVDTFGVSRRHPPLVMVRQRLSAHASAP